METYSLILQADYHRVSLGLCRGADLIDTQTDDKHNASKNLVSRINTILKKNNLSWGDLSFIGLNQGPAPFTTLRVIITTANGLNFAQKLPLVGVDGIKTFLQERIYETPVTVVLLNAFAKDIYFGIQSEKGIATGWENHTVFFESLKKDFPNTPLTFIGNGVSLYHEQIKELFESQAHIPTPFPEYVSLQAIGNTAFSQWEKKENVHDTLLPLYLKTQEYKTAL